MSILRIDRRQVLLGCVGAAIVAGGRAFADPLPPRSRPGAPADTPLFGPVDPAASPFDADPSGQIDSFAAFAAAVREAIRRARVNGGTAHLKPSPGRYLIHWDGVTGYNPHTSGSTWINQRFCFVFNDPAVKEVIVDLSGVELLQGGADWTQWASMFLVVGGKATFLGSGAKLDYVNPPFLQGAVEAIGDSTIDIRLDPGHATLPSFDEIFEITQFSDHDAQRDERYPLSIAFLRSSYAATPGPAPMAEIEPGLYRISGFTPWEMSQLKIRAAVGTFVAAKGSKDGPAWFNTIGCDPVRIAGFDCYASGESFALNTLSRNIAFIDNRIAPRPGSGAVVSCMRGGAEAFDCGGEITVRGCEMVGTGDDAVAVTGSALARMTRLGPASFRAYSTGFFYGVPPAGSRFVLYDAAYVEKARGRLDRIGPHQPGFLRDIDVTLSSGELPSDMTGCVATMPDFQPVADVSDLRIRNIRGRAVYTGAGGRYRRLTIENTSDEGILLQPTKGQQLASAFVTDEIEISDNDIRGACRQGFYPAAIRVFASSTLDSQKAALNTPLGHVRIENNTIRDSLNQAILVAGAREVAIRGNRVDNVAKLAPGGELSALGFAERATIGLINCGTVTISGQTVAGAEGATLYATSAHAGGAIARVLASENSGAAE
ncbi:right-handed parallel beta-helix repeat-containing protein [Hansschlegelia sp. KR7-227]|uniref:right-handed parallel beta-helix repeat-containing protein n=1 Tax=Hansschlegelia sp. KR7-227 TaxID=3400914 RepID=UPI003C08296D